MTLDLAKALEEELRKCLPVLFPELGCVFVSAESEDLIQALPAFTADQGKPIHL